MAVHRSQCYMTLVMSDSYLPGAMVLGHSLKDAGAERELVALVTLDTLAPETITELETLYHVIPVDRIGNSKPANLFLMGRPDLLYAFTKLALWRQTQYSKIVYIDADIVALRNLDDLFDIKANFAAAPDIGWPDAFNSGLMVLTPDMGDYWALSALAASGDSFDGADQGLLNQYYEHRPWQRLSFTYNCTPSAEYQWEPAYRYHKSNIKSVHFIGKDKPWFVGRQAGTGKGTYGELVGKWWSVYDRHYRSATPYVPGKSYTRSTVVQQLVFGEFVDDRYHGVPENERLPQASATDVAPALHQPAPQQIPYQPPTIQIQQASPAEAPKINPQDQSKEWQPPAAPWDATRSAPPSHSRPEAANFETGHYGFEEEKKEFKPPQKYPEPPKDMWYQVPKTKPTEAPKAIFPWEVDQRKRTTTRKFAEDDPPSPASGTFSPREVEWNQSSGGMEKYIRDIMAQSELPKGKQPDVTSPGARRESLVFTGLPDMQDRPSLPVTPAPGRTNTFWGDDEGSTSPDVSDQAQWNPEQKLEELRRSSLVEVVSLVSPDATKAKQANLASIPEAIKEPKKYTYTPKPVLRHLPSDDVSDLEIEADDGLLGSATAANTAGNSGITPRIPAKPISFSAPVYNKPSIDSTLEKNIETAPASAAAEAVGSPSEP